MTKHSTGESFFLFNFIIVISKSIIARDVPCALCSALCDAHNAHNAHNANPCNLYIIPVINKNHNISISINPTDIKHISSESSRQDELNGGLFIKIQSLDCEIIGLKVLFVLLRENHVILIRLKL